MWLPTALLPRFGIEWQAADDRHVMARFALDGVAVDLHYELEDDGRIRFQLTALDPITPSG